ncbi:hypothetical protein [Anaerofustis sp. NSJ-163]|uniref:hypothetical protein n=1 Tax=Anaerofustis sp. NSJ-163 TaxID=2944391 RepID=UPI00209C0D5C|nr:hypothetical protein [Anaerofustis sp. NSJ-163]MCO8193224.1 hypothetical protein [Anaerofustis sp. NSJ-163]
MKKMKLFVMFYMVKMFERIGDNMYLNIRVELKKNENQVVNDRLVNMYKRYFKFRAKQLKIKKRYLDLALHI